MSCDRGLWSQFASKILWLVCSATWENTADGLSEFSRPLFAEEDQTARGQFRAYQRGACLEISQVLFCYFLAIQTSSQVEIPELADQEELLSVAIARPLVDLYPRRLFKLTRQLLV